MRSKPLASLRVAGLLGILGPILTFILISLAIANASWFNWTENALSDLGVHGIESVLFNSGLIIGGILDLIFAGGVMRFYQNQTVGKVGAYLFLLTTIFLCLIGVFPETAPDKIHYIVSVGFFVSLPLALLFLAAAMLQSRGERKIGTFTIVIAIIAISPWVVPNPWKGVAIPELISAFAAATWSITMGIRLLRKTQSC